MKKLFKWMGLALVVQTCALPAPALAESPDNCTPGMNCRARSIIATAAQGTAASQCLLRGGSESSGVCVGGSSLAVGAVYLGINPSARSGTSNAAIYSEGTFVVVNAPGTGSVYLRRGDALGWRWDGVAFGPETNGLVDLGSSINRVRDGYFGGTVSTGPIIVSGVAYFSAGISQEDNNGAQGVRIEDNVGLSVVGVPTASLVPCNATAPGGANGTRGTIQYDTSTNTMKVCDGSGWRPLNRATFSAYNGNPSGAAGNAIGGMRFISGGGQVNRLAVTPVIAGSGAGSFTVEVFDVTTALQKCVSAAIPCTSGPGAGVGFGNSCAASFAAADDLAIRIATNGCTTLPEFNAAFEYSM